ncbi:hypothetical protein N184_13270 [Sinorhizobium sp. GL28]|nr:hypothetical protein N183_20360 [Sinorhizobium sp. Sb3]KSV83215.1 hypothetical protein N184_13270 [Sinorhizobium sp. GL28]
MKVPAVRERHALVKSFFETRSAETACEPVAMRAPISKECMPLQETLS